MTPDDVGEIPALVERTLAGDRNAFGRIVRQYERRLYGLACLMTRDHAGAEDIVQEAFVRAYRKLDRFDRTREFYPWLATIATRLCQNWLAARARIARREGAELPAEIAAAGANEPAAALASSELGEKLRAAIAALPYGERLAVWLVYRQEMRVADAARVLGVTDGTVKTWLFRARRKLRPQFARADAFEENGE